MSQGLGLGTSTAGARVSSLEGERRPCTPYSQENSDSLPRLFCFFEFLRVQMASHTLPGPWRPLPPECRALSILGAHGHPSKAGVPPARTFCHRSCPPPSLPPGGAQRSRGLAWTLLTEKCVVILGWTSPGPSSPATSTVCSSRRTADRSGPILAKGKRTSGLTAVAAVSLGLGSSHHPPKMLVWGRFLEQKQHSGFQKFSS